MHDNEQPDGLTPLNRIPADATYGVADPLIAKAAEAAAAAYAAHRSDQHPDRGCDDFRVFLIAKVAESLGAGAGILQPAAELTRFWLMQNIRPHLKAVYTFGPEGGRMLGEALTSANVPPELVANVRSLVSIVAAVKQIHGVKPSTEAEVREAIAAIVKIADAANGGVLPRPAAPQPAPTPPPMFMKRGPRDIQ
jgi:hypothetical protein